MQRIRILLYSFFILISGNLLFAQSKTLVRFDELNFNSEFEKEAFLQLQNGNPDYLRIFLSVDPTMDANRYSEISTRIQTHVTQIGTKKFDKLKDEKKISLIYKSVNDNVLSRYEEKILFPDIFLSGKFNCLTASAYYGFLFDKLGIAYDFRETMNHVHPVAFPNTLQVKVETTDMINGFQYFDQKLKLQFLGYLINTKIISKEEAKNTSLDSIFNRYYFPESEIGIKELAGLQYLNDAFFKLGEENFTSAFRQVQKAYFLYPSKRISTLMLFLLSGCIGELDYKEIEDVSYLGIASRFVGKDLDEKIFLGEFTSLTEEVLIGRSQIKLYDQMFDTLMKAIEVEGLRDQVRIIYHSQKGRVLMTIYRVKEAFTNFETALNLQPGNIELQTVTVQSLGYILVSESHQEIVNTLEEFEKKFPLMQYNESFISLQMLAYLNIGEEKFDFEKPVEAEDFFKKFENLHKLHPNISVQYEEVGDAYSAAAVYYFKRNNKTTAKMWLNRGLEASPDNYQLMYRLRALE